MTEEQEQKLARIRADIDVVATRREQENAELQASVNKSLAIEQAKVDLQERQVLALEKIADYVQKMYIQGRL